MFVDASVLVALVTEEADAIQLAARVDQAPRAITSPVAVYETVLAMARKSRQEPRILIEDLRAFLSASNIQVVAIDESTGYGAIDAQARFGKGTGHPARLNMGDCFAYAMAKQHGLPLLYKGDDFAQTDLA